MSNFNDTNNIAAAGLLTGATLAANVLASSLTSVGTLSALNVVGAVAINGTVALGSNSITMTGSLGATAARLTKGWFTDLQCTNAINASITGNAATVTTNANLTGDVTSSGNATTIGAGKVTEAMQVLADNTTNNASTSQHGYLKKLSNTSTEFMNGVGNWATPAATLPSGSITLLPGSTGIISAVASGTTQMPYDDTIPQNTEGDEYMSATVTPTNASNTLIIIATINYSNSSGAAACCAALFQDSTAGSLNAVGGNISGGSIPGQMMITHKMTAGTTSATTFKVRAGPNAAQTFTFNGASGARKFGGVMGSSILVYEVKA